MDKRTLGHAAALFTVLNWGTTSEARNSTHSFDAGEVFFASIFDGFIPVFSSHDFDASSTVFERFANDALHAVDDDDAIETLVVT